MPRPKRSKVASKVAAPTRVARPLKSTPTVAQPQNTKNTSDRIESFSDDSDGLVVKATRPRRRRPWEPEPQSDADFTMAGGLPVEEEKDSTSKRPTDRPSPKVVVASRTLSTPASTAFKRTQVFKGGAKASAKGVSPVNAISMEADDTPAQDDESSLLDPSLLTFGSLDSESPAHGTRPPSAMKVGGTPAHETSILALTNFRRRARQPSLLRMVHQTTDVEDNDLDLDDLDDFHPDNESTPLHVSKGGAVEENADNSGLSLSSTESRGKKRKLSSPVVQVPRSSPPYDPPSGADVADSRRSESPSLPEESIESDEEVVETQETGPQLMSETMAPPRSSSPAEEIEEIEDEPSKLLARGKRRGLRRRGHSVSEDEASGLPSKARAKQRSKAQTMTTAKLQALLPRRRTQVSREQDEYEIQGSDGIDPTNIDSDQDELQLPPPRRPAPSKSVKKPAPRTAKKSTIPLGTAKKNVKTYGRTSSDKENESSFVANEESIDVDEPTETSISLPKSKLTAIAKKFEDVDAWEMEFESVDVGGGSSSPWR